MEEEADVGGGDIGSEKEAKEDGGDGDDTSSSSDDDEGDSDEFMRRPRTIAVYEGNPIDVTRQDPVTVEEYKVLPLPWFRAVSV